MRKLEITNECPWFQDELVHRSAEIVQQWNDNADDHFDMATEVAGGDLSEDSKETLLLDFVKYEILDAIDEMNDYEWKNGYSDECAIWTCGRSGSHVWLHRNHRRVLLIRYPDPEEVEQINPALDWNHAKWIVLLVILMLLAKLVDNFLI